jgi:IclR family transcriptional regulator, acetate operon repressor
MATRLGTQKQPDASDATKAAPDARTQDGKVGGTSIGRTMRTLELLAGEPRGLRVTDLANALEVNRAIPHRILSDLTELGYVIQDPRTERYRVTFKVGSLGLRQLETAGIIRWAQDELDKLAAKTRELVRLAVVSEDTLRWVAKAQGSASALTLDGVSGAQVVPHATASGKAWLSTLPQDEAAAYLTERGLAAQTARTETDLFQVLQDIAVARARGFALVEEEMEVGVCAIAVPIVPPESGDGRAVATVSIAGPVARLSHDRLVGFAPALTAVARQLGAQWHTYEYMAALSEPITTMQR